MLKLPVYFDNAATTALDPRVFDAIVPYLNEQYGNPASRQHRLGWSAESAVEKSRRSIASSLGASEREIIFTSGATEANNLAIFGIARQYGDSRGKHIITTTVEHKSVLEPIAELEEQGFSVTYLDVDSTGRVSPEDVEKALRSDTLLVSIMAANNELGTLNPIASIGRVCRARKVIFHTDAAQAFGKIPLLVQGLNVDLLTLNGHKIYGPKGIGALYCKRRAPRVTLRPLLFGGGQERGMRPGTLNVPAIVGLGVAAEIAQSEMTSDAFRISNLRNKLYDDLQSKIGNVSLNGHPTERLPGHLNIRIEDISGEALMLGLKELAISSGSACLSSTGEPSYVLKKIGLSPEDAASSVRIVLGRFTTEEEVNFCVEKMVNMVKRIRILSSRSRIHDGVDFINQETR